MNRDYGAFYKKIANPFRKSQKRIQALKWISRILTGLVYVSYGIILLWEFCHGYQTGGKTGAVREVLPYILVPGISFCLVSIVRDRINRKRPYEQWPIEPIIVKKTKGHSMPSRHVFSTAVIAMCALNLNVVFGILLLITAAAIAVIRVIGGIHYPEDVLAGYGIGVAAGSVLFFL